MQITIRSAEIDRVTNMRNRLFGGSNGFDSANGLVDRASLNSALRGLKDGNDGVALMAAIGDGTTPMPGPAGLLNYTLDNHGSVSCQGAAAWVESELSYLRLSAFLEATFESVVIRERQGDSVRVEVTSGKLDLPGIFALVEKERAGLGIEGYSISQTTLEQIFNQFAAQQEEEKGGAAGIMGGGGGGMGGTASVSASMDETKEGLGV